MIMNIKSLKLFFLKPVVSQKLGDQQRIVPSRRIELDRISLVKARFGKSFKKRCLKTTFDR